MRASGLCCNSQGIVLKGSPQSLLCFCLHLEMRLTKLLKISIKNTELARGIVRLTVEWFMRRENVDGLDGNGLLKTYVFSMEDKMAAEH